MLINKKRIATLKEVSKKVSLANKRILMRADLDIPRDENPFRLERMRPSIDYILSQNPQSLTLIGHRGRPKGTADPSLSLNPVKKYFQNWYGDRLKILKNLRFDRREEQEDMAFAKELAEGRDVFVQECFSTLHRRHTSITLVPTLVPQNCIGLNVEQELAHLSRLHAGKVSKPFVVLLGGAKAETKLPLVPEFEKMAGQVLLGSSYLKPKRLDLSKRQIESYKTAISQARTILWNGPLGQYEKEEYAQGTKEIAQAVISNRRAFKVAGGGDTLAALSKWHLLDRMDFVSTGGGAMLEYVLGRKLPGLEVL